jgi:hypothetical protein
MLPAVRSLAPKERPEPRSPEPRSPDSKLLVSLNFLPRKPAQLPLLRLSKNSLTMERFRSEQSTSPAKQQ